VVALLCEDAMIVRVYVDNYKCFVNFEYQPAPLQLIFGENGSGKTGVFDVLECVRDFVVSGKPTVECFPASTLTAWQNRAEQTYCIEIQGNGGRYRHELVIEHRPQQQLNRVRREELRFDGNVLYRFDGENAHLFRDNFTAGPVFPLDWSRSGLTTIPERHDNQRLVWYRRRLAKTYIFSPNPRVMRALTKSEQAAPNRDLADFSSWYRHVVQDSPERQSELFESLGRVIVGFAGLKFSSAGEGARALQVRFKRDSSQVDGSPEFVLSFSALSDGQRCLIALFAILHFAIQSDVTICLDEPDNYVALRELQPWFLQLREAVEQRQGQCLLVSHHPELIDLAAVRHGVRFARDGQGPVRVKPVEWAAGNELRPSEVVARGWEE
jgi:predicted ATPase